MIILNNKNFKLSHGDIKNLFEFILKINFEGKKSLNL